MIVPLVAEAAWLAELAALPAWDAPREKTVVLSPHPDDETLGAGGLIARLCSEQIPVSVVAATDGENCYAGEDLGSARQVEQRNAVRRLGVPVDRLHRLGLPDSGLGTKEAELYQAMLPLLTPDTHLVAPWTGDFHPDHEVCGRVAAQLAATLHLRLTFYFFWTWHRGTVSQLRELNPQRFTLTPEEQATKREALFCHESQLSHPSGEPILPWNLLEPAWRNFEVYLPA